MKSEGHPKYQLYAHPVSEQHRTFTDYWWAHTIRGTPQISFWCSACTRVTTVIHDLLVGIYKVGGHPKYQFYAECVSEWQRSFTAYQWASTPQYHLHAQYVSEQHRFFSLSMGNRKVRGTPQILAVCSVRTEDGGHTQLHCGLWQTC